jgi:hypothetical protein
MTSYPISISGSGLVEGTRERLFVPRLDNQYEQILYEKIEKKSGIKFWNVNQFNNDNEGNHLDAVAQAFEDAMKSAGLYRKINKKISPRVGVVYFNMYGPTSFMNKEFQVKEMYQSDVFPAFLLNNHNITGYSVRLRGERNSLFQGIELAKTLIQSGELDIVVVGGVFQTYSYLYLTEMLASLQWQEANKLKVKKSTDKYHITESAGFIVLESSNTSEKRQAHKKLNIEELSSYSVLSSKSFLDAPSLNVQFKQNIDHCYFGLHGRTEVSQVERMLLKDTCPGASHIDVTQGSSDLVNLNAVKVLHQSILSESNSNNLLHSIDRDGCAWNLIFTNNHKK